MDELIKMPRQIWRALFVLLESSVPRSKDRDQVKGCEIDLKLFGLDWQTRGGFAG